MTAITWDGVGQKKYETGVDHGVLYKPNASGVYNNGFPWNGLVTVTESPTGGEANPQYADNIKYLNLYSVEEFAATIEAYTYPDEFSEHDGSAEPEPGVTVGQQPRKPFGLSYRTKVGNDLNQESGYKIHLVWGATATPSEKAYGTINDSPEAIAFSWEITTTPVSVTGLKPTASMVIDSTKVPLVNLQALEELLYGTVGSDPSLPTPDEVLAIFAGSITEVFPTEPSFVPATDTITIPSVTGVIYQIDGETVPAGPVVITEDTIVTAKPAAGYSFQQPFVSAWHYDYTP